MITKRFRLFRQSILTWSLHIIRIGEPCKTLYIKILNNIPSPANDKNTDLNLKEHFRLIRLQIILNICAKSECYKLLIQLSKYLISQLKKIIS